MTITGKEMNHGEKSPQVYVKPEGIYIENDSAAGLSQETCRWVSQARFEAKDFPCTANLEV